MLYLSIILVDIDDYEYRWLGLAHTPDIDCSGDYQAHLREA